MVKSGVDRKEAARKKVLGARDEVAKDLYGFTKKLINIKRCIYQSKKKVNKQFGRKMNQDVDGNRKLFW